MFSRHLPLKQGLLIRARVNELFEQGMSYPLLTVLAGPGYGKTQAAASYLSTCDVRLVWLRLTATDNLRTSFWDNLVRAVAKEIPQLADRMQAVQFPDTLDGLDMFLRELAGSVYEGEKMVWLIDDFGLITDPQILRFFSGIAEAELENFCLVLMSSAKASIEVVAGRTSNKFSVSGEDLCFTQEEIEELFGMHDIVLRPDELALIEENTGGWPLPLYLLITQYDGSSGFLFVPTKLTRSEIHMMFEQRFFEQYSPEIKRLLVSLSLLDGFPQELLRDLYAGPPEDLKLIEDNVFIIYTYTRRMYSFHNLYRMFLGEKKYMISREEETALYRAAADNFARAQNYLEAITCYRMCDDFENMLKCIFEYARSRYTLSTENADFILEQIRILTPAQREKYPVADYILAHIYAIKLEADRAERILFELERRLLGADSAEARELLGDVYNMLGGLHMMRNQEDFGDYFKKACDYLPEGTRFQDRAILRAGNNHIFSMSDNQPGAKERMEQAVSYGVEWAVKALNGAMQGMGSIFSAEAAYMSYDFTAARKHAYQAIYKAQEAAQHDIVCNAHCILARAALMRADFDEMSEEIQTIVDYADRYDIGVLKEIRDTALAWYYVKVDDSAKVPRWMITMSNQNQPPLNNNRAVTVYANYLIHIGEYERLIAILENSHGLHFKNGIWADRIALLIKLAIGYNGVNEDEKATGALWSAYDMTRLNDLTTPFIESGKYMRKLIQVAQKQDEHEFDSVWLDSIYSRSNTYAKKLIVVQNAYNKKKNGGAAKLIQLSKREKEILYSLSQGLTREEIADFYSISINTVKSILTSIYSKLGAVNRADAIYIAMTEGYLD